MQKIRPHKVLTYVEYRAVSGVFQNLDPPPPSPPSECVLPPHQRGGTSLIRGTLVPISSERMGPLSPPPALWMFPLACTQGCRTELFLMVPVPIPTFEKFWFGFRFQLLKKLWFRFRFYFLKVTVPVPFPTPYLDHIMQIFQEYFWVFFAFLHSKLFYKEKV
jgi:hypothetical protein